MSRKLCGRDVFLKSSCRGCSFSAYASPFSGATAAAMVAPDNVHELGSFARACISLPSRLSLRFFVLFFWFVVCSFLTSYCCVLSRLSLSSHVLSLLFVVYCFLTSYFCHQSFLRIFHAKRIASENEVAAMKATKKRLTDISELDRQMAIVEKAAGIKARYEEMQGHVKARRTTRDMIHLVWRSERLCA